MDPMTRELEPRWRAGTELLIAPWSGRHALAAQAAELARRGDVRPLAAARWSDVRGRWEIPIQRLRPIPSPWRRRAFIAGAISAMVGGAVALIGWVLSTLAPAALAVLCVAALLALIALVRAGRRPRVSVTTVTTVNIR